MKSKHILPKSKKRASQISPGSQPEILSVVEAEPKRVEVIFGAVSKVFNDAHLNRAEVISVLGNLLISVSQAIEVTSFRTATEYLKEFEENPRFSIALAIYGLNLFQLYRKFHIEAET